MVLIDDVSDVSSLLSLLFRLLVVVVVVVVVVVRCCGSYFRAHCNDKRKEEKDQKKKVWTKWCFLPSFFDEFLFICF